MGMGFKFHMGMGMKSLKWEGTGTKNLFPHTSTGKQQEFHIRGLWLRYSSRLHDAFALSYVSPT